MSAHHCAAFWHGWHACWPANVALCCPSHAVEMWLHIAWALFAPCLCTVSGLLFALFNTNGADFSFRLHGQRFACVAACMACNYYIFRFSCFSQLACIICSKPQKVYNHIAFFHVLFCFYNEHFTKHVHVLICTFHHGFHSDVVSF